MREYDRSQPLIAIHVPKTAGTSVRRVFERWFGDDLLTHYRNRSGAYEPAAYDLADRQHPDRPLVVYGHFNRARGRGIETLYPDVRQYVTILREPFERAMSRFHYLRERNQDWSEFQTEQAVRDYVLERTQSMLEHLPELTFDDHARVLESRFVEIGVTERLDASMRAIAGVLDQPYEPSWLERLNVTPRVGTEWAGLLEAYMERNRLEYAVYEFARRRHVA